MPALSIVSHQRSEIYILGVLMVRTAGAALNKTRQIILTYISVDVVFQTTSFLRLGPFNYDRLSSNDLLVKCLDGKTQNQNESLNGMIWNRLPKRIFVGGNVLQLGVYDAVAHFNMGSRASVDILQQDG